MDIFDVLTLIGGLCLFLFGMNIMGSALERSAGNKLENMIGKLSGKAKHQAAERNRRCYRIYAAQGHR